MMKRTGFTLIEILVTLVIVTLFSSAVYTIFLSSLIDTRRAHETTSAWRAGQAIVRLMEQDLTACAPANDEYSHFTGSLATDESSHLELITTTDARSGQTDNPADLTRVTYTLAPGNGEEELASLYRQEDPGGGRAENSEMETRLLHDQVQSFNLEYYDGTNWLTLWADPQPPRAVRVNLVIRKQIQTGVRATVQVENFAFNAVLAVPVGR